MLAITQDNTRNLTSTAAARKPKGHDKKSRAQAEAVHVLGPQARDGFEYTTSKVDGRWYWHSTDESPAPTAAQIKANGGKRSLLQTTITTLKATAKNPDLKKVLATVPKKMLRDDQCAGGDAFEPARPKKVGNDVPPEQSAAERKEVNAAVDLAQQDAKVEVVPDATHVGMHRVKSGGQTSDMVNKTRAKDAASAATRAAKAAPATAASKQKTRGVGDVAREAILAGKTNEQALAAVMEAFPDCSSNLGCMNWYRNDLKKKGLLGGDDGSRSSSKGPAMPKGGAKARPPKAGR